MKYRVMECHPGYAVVLDEEGRFMKVANLQYETGQTVTDVIEMEIPQAAPQKKNKRKRWICSAAAMAACLAVAAASILQTERITYASVYMMINPEVRIDVNRKDVVVGLEGANADGEELIEDYSYQKKELDLVMDELVDRAIDMGYLHEGGQISLTLDAENDEWIVDHNDMLGQHLAEHMNNIMSVTIEVDGEVKQSNIFTIPVIPETDDYEEDDYGDDTVSPDPSAAENTPASANPSASADTPAVSEGGDSGYDDGQTDYGDQSDDDSDDDGQSEYQSSDDDSEDD